MLTVPAMCFEPTEASKYLVLEVKLDNPRCAFDVQPNGDIPSDMRWKLTAYASDPAAVRVDRRHGSRKLFRPNALFVERGRLSQVQGDGSVRQARRGASREGVFRRGERAANPGVPRTLRRHRGARGGQGSSFTGGNRAPRRRRGRGGSRPAGHRARPAGAQARAPGYRRAQGDLHVGVRGA